APGTSSDGSGGGGSSGEPSTTAPPPSGVDPAQGADGTSPVGGGPGQVIPPDAQALLDAGVDPDRAARLAYGNFPVAGPAHWVDDWHAPRFTGTLFRWHEGVDLVADYGTPLRAPADGTAVIGSSPLGGLAVKIVQPDGTFYYLAHLSATADGLVSGTPVHIGDLVGYVGQSGD